MEKSLEEIRPLISIIVPVYKVEKYLPACLDSVRAQTYLNIEVILVDDGSPDCCGQLCDKYVEENGNFHVIHQVNQGLSVARNNGVKESKGDFIFYLDSDDFISPGCIEYLFNLIQKHRSDIAVAKPCYYWDDLEVPLEKYPVDDICYNTTDALKEMCYGEKFGMSAWNKLIKREIALKYPFPAGKIYEEVATTYKILGEAKKIAYGAGVTYFYRMREGSIVHGKISDAQLYGLQASEEMLQYVIQNYPGAQKAAEFRCFAKICDFVPKSYGDRNIFNLLRSKSKKYSESVMKNNRVSMAMKLRYVALRSGYFPARVIFTIVDGLKKQKYRRKYQRKYD